VYEEEKKGEGPAPRKKKTLFVEKDSRASRGGIMRERGGERRAWKTFFASEGGEKDHLRQRTKEKKYKGEAPVGGKVFEREGKFFHSKEEGHT